jgi:NADH-quinone oxidoreductase subunit J
VIEFVLFLGLACGAVVAALLVVTHRHPVYSALFLVVTMVCIAFLFLLLRAEFLWVMQIAVYAGAVMVLFLFVIMLLDLRREERVWRFPRQRLQVRLGVVLAAALAAEVLLAVVAARVPARPGPFPPDVAAVRGNTQLLGQVLYTEYAFPFEVTSVILLVAIVGAMVIAKKRPDE